jgi:hypothetical protein
MAKLDKFDPLNPIPNTPFSSQETWGFYTPQGGPFSFNTGFTISPINGSVSVTQVGAPVVGTVTDITSGTGIITSPVTGITVSGSIALTPLGAPLTPGSYTFATATVDLYGRVTNASSGVPPFYTVSGDYPIRVTGSVPTINVDIYAASTTNPGAAQLCDDLVTQSASLALTAKQGYTLNQKVGAINVSVQGQFYAGTFSVATQTVTTATSQGIAAGFIPVRVYLSLAVPLWRVLLLLLMTARSHLLVVFPLALFFPQPLRKFIQSRQVTNSTVVTPVGYLLLALLDTLTQLQLLPAWFDWQLLPTFPLLLTTLLLLPPPPWQT